MLWLLLHPLFHLPLPSASCIFFSVFLCVADRAYWRRRGWGRSQIIQRRESLVLFKTFNTLWTGSIVSLVSFMELQEYPCAVFEKCLKNTRLFPSFVGVDNEMKLRKVQQFLVYHKMKQSRFMKNMIWTVKIWGCEPKVLISKPK